MHKHPQPDGAAERPQDPNAKATGEARQRAPVSFVKQVGALQLKNFRQKKRSACGCCLELLLPIVFVLGLVGLWSVSTREKLPAEHFVPQGANPELTNMTDLTIRYLCRNVTFAPADPDADDLIPACPSDASNPLKCAHPGLLPLDGLCAQNQHNLSTWIDIVGWHRGVVTGLEVPSLDQAILIRWLGRIVFGDIATDAATYQQPINSLALGSYLYIGYENETVINMMETYLNSTWVFFKYVYGGSFESPVAALDFTLERQNNGKVWTLIAPTAVSDTDFEVTLRNNGTAVPWNIVPNRNWFGTGLGWEPHRYYFNIGFFSLQLALQDFYVQGYHQKTNASADIPASARNLFPLREHVGAAIMPLAPYRDSGFLRAAGFLAPLMLTLAYLYSVSQLVKRMVEEKEKRLREGMLIMGLHKVGFFFSWLLTYVLQQLFSSILITIILKLTILEQTDWSVVFLLFFLFALSTITFATFMSTFFSSARTSAVVSPMIFFATSMPLFLTGDPSAALGFLPPNIFAAGCQLAFHYEKTRGIGWQDSWSTFDDIKLGQVMIWLAVDVIGYLLLTLYLDAVLPSQWGTRLHPLFCFLGLCGEKKTSANADDEDLSEQELKTPKLIASNPFREVTSAFSTSEPSIRLRNLTKTFEADGSTKTAVNKINLDIYPDEITVLLGHNGAGKTTTISMLTGMIPVDGGNCEIYGNSVLTDLPAIRQDIGFCPQHNILWDDLTVREHLEFYQAVKGMNDPEEINQIIHDTDLGKFEHVLSAALSGGNKRKLSIANCFVGGSRFILLDEPTAGMDVVARRHTWDLIKKMAPGRTILLTTHYMDEADLLGSQLAVMSHGDIVCSGSSMFLKSKLGVGYSLTLALEGGGNNNSANNRTANNRSNSAAQPHVIQSMIKEHIPKMDVVSAKAGELVLRLPTNAVDAFPDMLNDLETRGDELGIRSFGLGITTLEEVFLKIADGIPNSVASAATAIPAATATDATIVESSPAHNGSSYSDAEPIQDKDCDEECSGSVVSPTIVQVDGAASAEEDDPNSRLWPQGMDHECTHSTAQQFTSLFWKRFHTAKRDRKALCLQVVFPAVLILVAIVIGNFSPPDSPALYLGDGMLDLDGFPVVDVDVAAACGDLSLTTGFQLSGSPSAAEVPTLYNYSEHLLRTHDTHPIYVRDQAVYCDPAKTRATAFFNASGDHASVATIAMMAKGFTNQFLNTSTINFGFSAHRLPWTANEEAWADSFFLVIAAFFILIPFTFIPSNFVGGVVKEKETKAKHLQMVSGVHYAVYWISFYAFDFIMFFGTTAVCMIIFAIANRTEYVGTGEVFFATLLVFIFFGLSGIAFSYLCSFMFENHGTAQNIMLLVNFVTGFLLVMTTFVLSQIDSTKDAGKILKYIFRLFPSYCLGESIIAIAGIQWDAEFGIVRGPFHMDVTGTSLIYMACEAVVYFGLTMLLDHPARERRRQQMFHQPDVMPPAVEDEDADVAAERTAVESNKRPKDLVSMRHLNKKYPSGKVAVQNLSFGVRPAEVFAFLGTNGAGKTTTMSILTGEQLPTHGHGFVAGFDVVSEAQAARQKIGFCPQFDALIDLMTPKEHLELYAALRGVPPALVADVVTHLLKICCLSEYEAVPSAMLSGGNKRKLSVAISLIGSPKVLFLDEPSAGMDPASRRQLWGVIRRAAQDSSVVLTTHHLEEVEVLADRVAIMTAGALRCIGSLQHLKGKFGSGFEMSVKVDDPVTHMQPMVDHLTQLIPNATLGEIKQQRATFNLPREGTSLSQVFRTLRDNKDQLNISDYSFAQTSLEMVFVRISEEEDQKNATPHTEA